MNEQAAIIGGFFIVAMAVIGGIGVAAHIIGQLIERRRWRRLEAERNAAIRSGLILKGGGR